MKYVVAILLFATLGLSIGLYYQNDRTDDKAASLENATQSYMECMASKDDLQDEVMAKNERIIQLMAEVQVMEAKYQRTYSYRTRTLLSKINPFDDNYTE